MKNKRSMLIGWGAGVLSTTLVTGIITAVSASGGNVWGDVNKDGIVNIGDVIHLRRYLAGWDGYGDPDDTDATKTTGITRTTATTSYVDINGNLTSDKTTTSQSIWTDTPETTSINTITTLSTKTETAKTTTGTAFTTITTLATDLTTTNTTSTTAVTKTTALNTTNTAGTTAVTTTATVTTNTTASGERLYNGKPVLDWKPAPPNPWTWYAKGTLVLYDGYIWELNAVEVSYEDAVKDPNPIYDADNADPSVGYSAMRGNGAEPGGSWNFYVKRVAAPSEWDTSTTTAPSATSTSGDTQGGYQALYPLLDVSKSEPGAYLNESKLCYLTFDDGPNTATTPALLNKLDTLGIKATFFLVPRDTAESKALIKQIYDSGHSIGIHSATHSDSIYNSVEDFLYDYEQARKIIVDATGNDDISEYLTSYRLPYGYYGMPNTTYRAAIVEEMTRRGFKEFDWNVDTNDWNAATTADEILSRVQSQFKTTGRNIILCHDAVSSKSDDILEDIVDYVLSKGYTFSGILSNSAEQLGGF